MSPAVQPVLIQDSEFWENILPVTPVPDEVIFTKETQVRRRFLCMHTTNTRHGSV